MRKSLKTNRRRPHGDSELHLVMNEKVTVAEVEVESESDIEAPIDAKSEANEVKIQVKDEQPTEIAAKGKWLVGIDGDKSDSLVQQSIDDQIDDYEVISKTLTVVDACEKYSKTSNVVDTCEKLDGAYSIVFVDKLFDVNDPYSFRLLVMGNGNDLVPSRYVLNGGKIGFETYFSRVTGNAYMLTMKNFYLAVGEKESRLCLLWRQEFMNAQDDKRESLLEEIKDLSNVEILVVVFNLQMYVRALHFSNWLEMEKQLDFVTRDNAYCFDLITMEQGLQRADYYIQKVQKSFKKECPHMLFYGPLDTGKTTTALVIAHQLFGPELYTSRVLELDTSDDHGVNVVRTKIKDFSAVVVGSGQHQGGYPCPPFKMIILDKADSLSEDAQNALRRIMETYSKITRFFFICKFISRIIEPLASMCAKFRFKPLSEEIMSSRILHICDQEGMSLDSEALSTLSSFLQGDFLRAITYLQGATHLFGSSISSKYLISVSGVILQEVVEALYAACKVLNVQKVVKASILSGFKDEFYQNLVKGRGILFSDQQVMVDERTARFVMDFANIMTTWIEAVAIDCSYAKGWYYYSKREVNITILVFILEDKDGLKGWVMLQARKSAEVEKGRLKFKANCYAHRFI